jgi:predicted PurR-regulated permease PerM
MGVTLAVLGVPLVAPLAVLVFIGGFIPLIGAVVFGGLAVLVTLVTNGPTAALVVLIVLIVGNQIESHVLQPFVVGRHVSLHPMAIAVTLTSGAVLAGLPGAIFAVPLVAAVNAAAVELRPPPGTDRLPSAAAIELES